MGFLWRKEKRRILKRKIIGFWSEYSRSKTGMAGLIILLVFVAVACARPWLTTANPRETFVSGKYAAPTWSAEGAPKNFYVDNDHYVRESRYVYHINLTFNYPYSEPPDSFVVTIELEGELREPFSEDNPGSLKTWLIRPDGRELLIHSDEVRGEGTCQIYSADLKDEVDVIKLASEMGIENPELLIVEHVIFGDVENAGSTLKGTYTISVTVIGGLRPTHISAYFRGRAYGVLGTDWLGRDVWSQLLEGVIWALYIGILSSVLSVTIGIVYGLVSGYIGGRVDELMMRVTDILIAIPKLPMFICLAVLVGRPMLEFTIMIIAAFGWMGLAKVARSMVLSLRERAFVEVARAIGAGHRRIMFKHIMPHLFPLAFANLALSVPDAILTEAALSFLGLSDPWRITWGRMLHEAQSGAALAAGAWWCVIPPGLCIAMLSMSFIFIGHAIDEILNPRLRRRR